MPGKATYEQLELRVKELEKEAAERKRAEEVLWESARQLRAAYDQSIKYAKDLNQDIAERKRVEDALCESEGKYSTLVESSLMGIYIEQDEKIVFANKTFAEIYGYSRDELLGMESSKLIHPEDRALTGYMKTRHLKGEEAPSEYEARGMAKGGKIIWVKGRSTWIEYNERPAIMDNIADITESKRTEEEKKQLVVQLQQAQKMEAIGTLAGGIAHDFNNILSAVMGFSELALDDIPEEKQSNLLQVLDAGRRAKDLVKQILTFSRSSKEERKPIQVSSIVKEALKLLRASLPATIEIRKNIGTRPSTVMADPSQIHQVLMNLCTNAGHAMQKKGGVLEVSLSNAEFGMRSACPVECEAYSSGAELKTDQDRSKIQNPKSKIDYPDLSPGPYLRLTVSDTGEGMVPGVMERIFEPYFTTKEKEKGTGLGLAMVHGIVESHGGTVKVHSELGKGSTFEVYLPLIQEADKKPEIDVTTPPITGHEQVLLIDDEKIMAEMGKRMLDRIGYEVTIRTSSIEALELFRVAPDRFDIVITDLTMPNMTGFELAKELMQIRPDIPIILCTGFSETITEDKAKAAGIREFLLKPIAAREMAKAIRQVLDG